MLCRSAGVVLAARAGEVRANWAPLVPGEDRRADDRLGGPERRDMCVSMFLMRAIKKEKTYNTHEIEYRCYAQNRVDWTTQEEFVFSKHQASMRPMQLLNNRSNM